MKIVHIVPGFGGTFYCGNCLRDSAFASTLREAGHEAVILPMYLPLTLEGNAPGPVTPVFYGAVNIYLKQQFPPFRHVPQWMENLFDSKPLLKLAARKSGSTRAHGLEQLTESMLLGRDGNQRRELARLVKFLREHEKPDIVHLSNALLIGIAAQVREEVKVPVVVSLQDEDVWIDAMDPLWQTRMWDLMAEKCRDADAFISVSRYFADVMHDKASIPREKMHVVGIGVRPGQYRFAEPAVSPRAVGYLSRINEENGFGILAEAFLLLKQEAQFSDLKLIATGGMTGDDQPFLRQIMKKMESHDLLRFVEIREDFSREALPGFFRDCTVLSVPVLKGEAFGLYQIEAMASGIPLVQPALGAFPEVIGSTGGGVIYEPNTPEKLAGTLSEILPDWERLLRLGRQGRESVEASYDARKLAVRITDLYSKLIS